MKTANPCATEACQGKPTCEECQALARNEIRFKARQVQMQQIEAIEAIKHALPKATRMITSGRLIVLALPGLPAADHIPLLPDIEDFKAAQRMLNAMKAERLMQDTKKAAIKS